MIRRQELYSGVAIGFGDKSCNSTETGAGAGDSSCIQELGQELYTETEIGAGARDRSRGRSRRQALYTGAGTGGQELET